VTTAEVCEMEANVSDFVTSYRITEEYQLAGCGKSVSRKIFLQFSQQSFWISKCNFTDIFPIQRF